MRNEKLSTGISQFGSHEYGRILFLDSVSMLIALTKPVSEGFKLKKISERSQKPLDISKFFI